MCLNSHQPYILLATLTLNWNAKEISKCTQIQEVSAHLQDKYDANCTERNPKKNTTQSSSLVFLLFSFTQIISKY